MVVGARWAGLSVSQPADLLPSLGFTEDGPKKRKHPVSGSSGGRNNL